MSTRDKRLKIVLPLLIIVCAAAVSATLVVLKKSPPKRAADQRGALVETLEVVREDYPVRLLAAGTVAARRQISLEAQVSGRVVALGEHFASGAFFRKGALLLQIEPTDYRLAVEQASAPLARAEVELATTESQAAIAREERQRLNLQEGAEPNPLVLYEPQLKNARANVASARASLEQSRLNLERTTLRAPFDVRVRSEQVDMGQFVRSGSSLATLTASREAEVIVSIPLDDLVWLRIPGPNLAGPGSPAHVSLQHAGGAVAWTGEIERALGEVDPRGRMLQVAVRVDDPYRLTQRDARPPYLEVGMFVEVNFEGPRLEQVVVLPRRALRDNQSVWLADGDDTLRMRNVEVLRLEKEQVVIGQGLENGERVVLTTLTGAADGMQLRTRSQEP